MREGEGEFNNKKNLNQKMGHQHRIRKNEKQKSGQTKTQIFAL
jgi:hypothetical protein